MLSCFLLLQNVLTSLPLKSNAPFKTQMRGCFLHQPFFPVGCEPPIISLGDFNHILPGVRVLIDMSFYYFWVARSLKAKLISSISLQIHSVDSGYTAVCGGVEFIFGRFDWKPLLLHPHGMDERTSISLAFKCRYYSVFCVTCKDES